MKTPDLLLDKDIATNWIINGNMDFWQRTDAATASIRYLKLPFKEVLDIAI